MRPIMRNQVPNTVKSQRSEEGFAIPIALGMGLIMILLATTAILRSQSRGVAAINKSATDQSRSVAELKVAQVQAFLNKYRGAANLSSTEWASATGTSFPTANALCIAPSALTGTGSAISEINSMGGTGWTDVDSTDLTKGQFRLISYTGSDGSLTVEGRSKVGTPAESLTQINVTIPVFSSDTYQVPSLWTRGGVTGNPTVNSDVMGPCPTTTAITVSFPSTGAYSDRVVIRNRIAMPPVPPLPTTNIKTLTAAEIANRTLGASGDSDALYNPDGVAGNEDDVYRYSVPSISESFTVAPGKKISIWVDGNINLENKAVVNPCADPLSSSTCDAFDLKIYGRSSSGSMTINQGAAICDAFFLLPNYSVTVNSGGTTPNYAGTTTAISCGSTAKNTGIYWVNTWNSATGTTLDANRSKWSDAPTQFLPRIGPLTAFDS
jgi:hypothetical protein